jgi:hypothetical protein
VVVSSSVIHGYASMVGAYFSPATAVAVNGPSGYSLEHSIRRLPSRWTGMAVVDLVFSFSHGMQLRVSCQVPTTER